MKKNILISITITDSEIDRSVFCNLAASIYRNNLSSAYLLVIYQTNKFIDFKLESVDEVISTNIFSTSNARNIAIKYAQDKQFEFIIFNDSSVVPNLTFLKAIEVFAGHEAELIRGDILWSYLDRVDLYSMHDSSFHFKKIDPLIDGYVGEYLFNVKAIGDIRFDLRLGGGGTVLNCGEDVIFLINYFKKNNINQVMVIDNAHLVHPPRELDYSKHLKYAYSQGVLYRHLLKKLNGLYMSKMIFLFLSNALFRVACGRPNARKIFKERLKGLWDNECCHKAFM